MLNESPWKSNLIQQENYLGFNFKLKFMKLI